MYKCPGRVWLARKAKLATMDIMLSELIRSYLRAVPFQPFVIRMNDGREFNVPHPDFATVSPKGTRIHVFDDREGGADVSALLVASVSLLNSATTER
jgi:hypothetical protein